MIHESVNLKGVQYSQNKTLSAFSLSPIVQVLQTLTRSFIKLITELWTNFQLNWKENLFRAQWIDFISV